MENLPLQPNECVILQSTSVLHRGFCMTFSAELILTNLNVFSVKRGMRRKIKDLRKYPLNQLKKMDGIPQILQGKNPRNGASELHIVFNDSQEAFEFQSNSKKQIKQWIDEVYKVFGVEEEIAKKATGSFFNKLKSGINSVKSIFTEEKHTVNITTKCIGCMAPLTGKKGELVKCKYCDTKQTLK